MDSADITKITVEATINAPIDKVWSMWTTPQDIIHWNNASEDWHTPKAVNDLRPAGEFNIRMEAKDGSTGFDFTGMYDSVIPNELITYTLGDGRKVKITFVGNDQKTEVIEIFEAETENSIELQRSGWQAILSNFKKYVESKI